MAIVRKSLDQIRSEPRTIDHARIAATTEEEIRQQAIEDGEDPDAPLVDYQLIIPARAVREKLGLSQEAFAKALHIPIGTIRNWEQNRVKPDPAARALLLILYRQPQAALQALRAA
ncbi:MAG: helix-turn-helix domain-containing protein [Roseiarcus sp.]